jgi:hypothetical protein
MTPLAEADSKTGPPPRNSRIVAESGTSPVTSVGKSSSIST